MVFNITIKERGSYGLRIKTTGKVVEKFRLKYTAKFMKSEYEKKYLEELEVVRL